jgi:hypothetical protein
VNGGLIFGAAKVAGKIVGVDASPNLEFLPKQTIQQPGDDRLIMASWFHLPIANHPRGGINRPLHVRTRSAADCWVRLEIGVQGGRGSYFDGRGVGVVGATAPAESFTVPVGGTAYVPLYVQLPQPTRHPWIPDLVLGAGTYFTSAEFIYQPELISSLRLTPGDYILRAWVHYAGGKLGPRSFRVTAPF